MKNKRVRFFHQYFWLILTIFVSLLPLTPLLHPGMFVAHDAQDHVARIANFYQNLQEGNVVPRWAANLNWGYGHPILMFLYPLPSYVASLFIALGFSFVMATKIVFALGFVGSGITMFIWIRKLWGDQASFVASIFYLFAPYRFVDLYVRGAIGENFFFIFPPLTCYFLLLLFKTKQTKFVPLTAMAIAGMVLSHNALAIMFLPFIAIYAFLLIFKEKNNIRGLVSVLFSFILGFGLSSFFLIPALLEGKYTLRDIVTKNEIFSRFETFSRLIYSPWTYGGSGQLSVQIGIGHWIVIVVITCVLGMYLLRQRYPKFFSMTLNDNSFRLVVLSVIFFWVSILLMLPVAKPIYIAISTLQKFQFPWRFLSLSVFTSAILAGVVQFKLSKKNIIAPLCIGVSVILLTISFWHPLGFIDKPDAFFSSVYEGTTDTGESAPIWSIRFMEKKPTSAVAIVEGQGKIEIGQRTTTKHSYTIETTVDQTRILENTLYFPGWRVFVNKTEVPFSELLFMDPNYRGLINFYIDSPGIHEVTIKFVETKLRLLSDTISGISGIIIIGLLLYARK